MQTADLRQIKHDLRTPVNHIVGYGELALETALDNHDPAAEEHLQRLVHEARVLAAAIDTEFTAERVASDPEAALAALKEQLSPTLDGLLDLTNGASGAFDPAPYEQDLVRIRTAIQRLSAFESKPPAPAAETTHIHQTHGSGDAEQILIVDDDAENRDVLVRMLCTSGYRLACAATGEEALEKLAGGGFDLVLLDMMMPGISGYEVLECMQSNPRVRDIPVVMISALGEVSAVARCIQAGADDYLPKPFEPVLLKARIGASLAKRRLRRQIVAQERLASLGSITAGVAHEIKNPLNFILNFADLSAEMAAELMVDEIPGSPRAALLADLRENLARILSHAKRADSIVAGMLLHARGGQTERESFELNKLVADSVNLAHRGAAWCKDGEQLQVELRPDPAVECIEGIPADIGRVVLNLTNNAIYAALDARRRAGKPGPAKVEVTTRCDGKWADVRVRDNGAGVPNDIKDRIFQPFFTTKPTGVGTGLGLSISLDVVVNAHGGEILLDSKDGEYAEFTVRLPKR